MPGAGEPPRRLHRRRRPAPAPAAPPAPSRWRARSLAAPRAASRAKPAPEQESLRDAKRRSDFARTGDGARAMPSRSPRNRAAPEALKNEAPAPFPGERSAATRAPSPPRRSTQRRRTATPSSAPRRSRAAPAAAANVAEADALRRADLASGGAAATGQLRAQPTAPAAKLQRQRAADDARDKSVAGFAAAAPTPFRSARRTGAGRDARTSSGPAGERARRDRRRAAALVAADRAAASVALEPGWRAWLGEVDAAAAGRWRASARRRRAVRPPIAAIAMAARRRCASSRGGSVAAVVRVDGTTVQVDACPAPARVAGRRRSAGAAGERAAQLGRAPAALSRAGAAAGAASGRAVIMLGSPADADARLFPCHDRADAREQRAAPARRGRHAR